MSSKNMYMEGAEKNGTHREFLLDNSNSLFGNKWGKENNKFFGDFGSPPCLSSRSGGIPCTKGEDPLNPVSQYKQDPNPCIRME